MHSPLWKRGARGDLLFLQAHRAVRKEQIPGALILRFETNRRRALAPFFKVGDGVREPPLRGRGGSDRPNAFPPLKKGGRGICFSSKGTASCGKSKSPALRFFASRRAGVGRSPLFSKVGDRVRERLLKLGTDQIAQMHSPLLEKGGYGGIRFSSKRTAPCGKKQIPRAPILCFETNSRRALAPFFKVGDGVRGSRYHRARNRCRLTARWATRWATRVYASHQNVERAAQTPKLPAAASTAPQPHRC